MYDGLTYPYDCSSLHVLAGGPNIYKFTGKLRRVALDKSEGSVKGIVVLGGASSTAAAPERLRTKTLEISR